ncbi:hypothetical protein GCM10023100_02750 [Actinocorallia cavernae]|uniref:Uncharacterized protein n=2 Tax=Actinomycetes TaxID=1760 RepID=A0ABP8S921_9ACTN
MPGVRAPEDGAEEIPLPPDGSVDDGVAWVAGLADAGRERGRRPRDTPADRRAERADVRLRSPAPGPVRPARAVRVPARAARRTADSPVATLGTRTGLPVVPDRIREVGDGPRCPRRRDRPPSPERRAPAAEPDHRDPGTRLPSWRAAHAVSVR